MCRFYEVTVREIYYTHCMRLTNNIYKSIQHFNKNNGSQIAAALSYYSLFALGPIFLILFFFLELFLSDIQTQNSILNELYIIFPTDIALVIGNVIQNIINYEAPTSVSGFIGVIVLLISSTTIIRELQKALNVIFEVKHPDKVTISGRLQNRIISFAFLILLGILILLSFILNTLLNVVGQYISTYIGLDPLLLYFVNLLISLFSVSLLFSILFKYLPDSDLDWKDILMGGLVTGMLFTIGKNFIAYVLGHANFGSLYGATGTILIFLIWVYYTSIIFLFGASLTYIFSKQKGRTTN